jgi:hypothetical protein
MSKNDELLDPSNVNVIGHLIIRDPDTGKVILRQRDKESKKNNDNKD